MRAPVRIQGVELSQQNVELRKALSQLNGRRIVQHADEIERLRSQFQHEIAYIDLSFGSRCGALALGMSADPIFCRLNKDWHLELDRVFWAWLIKEKLRLAEPMSEGALVLYFHDSVWSHAGRVVGAKVLSKWGTFPTYLHPLDQVPISYGLHVRFCEMPTRSVAIDWLLEYARGHGVPADTTATLRASRYSECMA